MVLAVPWCAPVCAHPSPAIAEPHECPGQGEAAVAAPAHRGTARIFCARTPSPQPGPREPVLSLPQVLPCLCKPSRGCWGGSQGPELLSLSLGDVPMSCEPWLQLGAVQVLIPC